MRKMIKRISSLFRPKDTIKRSKIVWGERVSVRKLILNKEDFIGGPKHIHECSLSKRTLKEYKAYRKNNKEKEWCQY